MIKIGLYPRERKVELSKLLEHYYLVVDLHRFIKGK